MNFTDDVYTPIVKIFEKSPELAAIVLIIGGILWLGNKLLSLLSHSLVKATSTLETVQKEMTSLRVTLVEHVKTNEMRFTFIERRMDKIEEPYRE